MATWTSKVLKVDIDHGFTGSICDVWWEYGTVSDYFRLNTKGVIPASFGPEKPFENGISMDKQQAMTMFQALANWLDVYEGEHVTKELLENNPFSKEGT